MIVRHLAFERPIRQSTVGRKATDAPVSGGQCRSIRAGRYVAQAVARGESAVFEDAHIPHGTAFDQAVHTHQVGRHARLEELDSDRTGDLVCDDNIVGRADVGAHCKSALHRLRSPIHTHRRGAGARRLSGLGRALEGVGVREIHVKTRLVDNGLSHGY